MRKLLLLIVLCLPMASFAQPGPLDINVGLKAGMNFTRMAGSTWTGGFRSGILAGAFGSVGIKKIGGQLEVLVATTTFTAEGQNFQNTSPSLLINPADSADIGSFSATYLNVPLLLNLKIFGNATLQLGPQFSSLLNVRDEDAFLNIKPEDVFNSSDIGGVVGVQLGLPLNINAGVRYIFGFNDQNLSSVGETWKLSSIQVHLGFSFL